MTAEDLEQIRSIVAEAIAEAVREARPRKSKAGLITLDEASQLIRTPSETIRRWIWEGRLTAYKPGRALLVKEAELLEMVASNETRAKRVARKRDAA